MVLSGGILNYFTKELTIGDLMRLAIALHGVQLIKIKMELSRNGNKKENRLGASRSKPDCRITTKGINRPN